MIRNFKLLQFHIHLDAFWPRFYLSPARLIYVTQISCGNFLGWRQLQQLHPKTLALNFYMNLHVVKNWHLPTENRLPHILLMATTFLFYFDILTSSVKVHFITWNWIRRDHCREQLGLLNLGTFEKVKNVHITSSYLDIFLTF